MKAFICFFLIAVASDISVATAQAPLRTLIDGNYYTDGQTAYIDCGKNVVNVSIEPKSDGSFQYLPIRIDPAPNFTVSAGSTDLDKNLNLDANRQTGYIHVGYDGVNTNYFITIYIIQKPPMPIFTSIPSLCTTGQSGSVSADVNYSFQGSKPIDIIWQTSGGITVNGGNTYTTNSSTSGTVTIQYSNFGTLTAYSIIPGCNNLQGPTSSPVYFGPPQINHVYVDNIDNSGPVAVNSGSTHYVHTTSLSREAPTYSLSTSTNGGNLNLSLSGVNNGDCQVYASGSIGNASLNIVASNSCGSSTRYVTFYVPASHRVAPNPAKNDLTISFSSVEDEVALPDQLEIVSEKEQKSVRIVNMKEVLKNHSFKNGNSVDFNITDLPRGIYYLKVTNPRQEKDKVTEMTRLVFEK